MVERAFLASGGTPRGARLLVSPFEFFTNGDDGLRLSVVNVVSGLTIALVARFVDSETGSVQANRWDLIPSTDGTESTLDIALPAGTLVNVAVRPLGAVVVRGQCYVRVDVIRGAGATVTLGTLVAGYVGSYAGRAWPGTPLESPYEGGGWIHAHQFPSPGANTGFFFVPAGTRWRLISVETFFTTSAVVITRIPFLEILQDTLAIAQVRQTLTIDASTTNTYVWGAGLEIDSDSNLRLGNAALPVGLVLASGASGANASLHLAARNAAVTDVWGTVTVLVEEWRDPATIFTGS